MRKKSMGCGCLGVLVLVIIGIGIVATRDDRPSGQSKAPSRSHRYGLTYDSSVGLPKYEVLDRKVYDAPIKTQVQLDLLVTGDLTPKALRNLLAKVFLKTDKQGGFKYHPTPTHVFIYAYPDKERAESGWGGWVAMLSKVGKDGHPDVDVNDRLLAALREKPVEKFGLSEAKRKQIWTQLVRAEDRAWKEAEAKYPLEPTSPDISPQRTERAQNTYLQQHLRNNNRCHKSDTLFIRIRLFPGLLNQHNIRFKKSLMSWWTL